MGPIHMGGNADHPTQQNAGDYTTFTAAQLAAMTPAERNLLLYGSPTNSTFSTGASDQGGFLGGFDNFLDTYTPYIVAAGLGAVTGGAATAALGTDLGATGATIAGGAIGGATDSAASDALTGQPLTAKSVGIGAATGALGGGLKAYNVNPYAAGAISGGAGAALNGGNVLRGVATGVAGAGISQGLQGAGIGSQIANPVGNAAASAAANTIDPVQPKTLPSPVASPSDPYNTPVTSNGALSVFSGTPNQSGWGALQSYSQPAAAAPATQPVNRMVANSVVNPATYGAGPEATFFTS